jgi:hypothetical protein
MTDDTELDPIDNPEPIEPAEPLIEEGEVVEGDKADDDEG